MHDLPVIDQERSNIVILVLKRINSGCMIHEYKYIISQTFRYYDMLAKYYLTTRILFHPFIINIDII